MLARLDPCLRMRGRSLELTRFTPEDISDRYLSWLNDPEVNYYSRRRNREFTKDDAVEYLTRLTDDHIILAIKSEKEGHVGNIGLGPVDWANRCCDVGILIGEKRVWGQGIAKEAIYLASRHLFETTGLHRIEAGSANPAFIAAVTTLGWRVEGTQFDRVLIDGTWHNWTWVSQLEHEFCRNAHYE
jgi:ribosomal-protein-alanine N-acetyltransferase